MKLHLPVRLRRALVSCMLVPAGVACSFSASAAEDEPPADERADLGNTMYVGDSITHGAYADLYSWRWSMHKIFVDNGISYSEVGVKTGNYGNAGTNMLYGSDPDRVFLNVHSAQNSARAWEIAERGTSGVRFGGTGIQHWLGLEEPDGWAGSSNSGFKLSEESKPVKTFFLLVGTNDLLSEGGSVGSSLAGKELNLMGRSENGGNVSWSGTGDMDTIVNAMFEHNPDASVTILSVPTWGSHNNNSAAADYAAVRTYNEHLKEWLEQNSHKENITLVDINRGLVDVANTEKPWKGVDDLFYSANDRLHPSAQGELIIAGNVARGLGYAGRTAGQERKAGTDFSYEHHSAGTIWENAGSKSDVTRTSTGGLTFAAGSSMQYSWSEGVDTSGGYTVEFKLDGGLGNGSNSGWDTINGLSISVGNGKRGGCLTVNEAYIQWGNKVLFSLDTSGDLTESLRVAYVLGRSSMGLSKGFYVWLGDQLIGEALSSNVTEAPDGLSVENGTNNSITISDLYLDNAPWAPTTTGYYFSNPMIGGGGKMPEAQYEGNPGVTDEWAYEQDLAVGELVPTDPRYGVSEVLDGKIGGTVNVRARSQGNNPTTAIGFSLLFQAGVNKHIPNELFVMLSPEMEVEMGYSAAVAGTLSSVKQVYARFLGGSYKTWFLLNNSTFSGPLYMEFSPQIQEDGTRSPLVLDGSTAAYPIAERDADYDAEAMYYNNPAVATFYGSGTLQGTLNLVFNGGEFVGAIYGGKCYGAASDSTFVEGGVYIYINGGTFTGNIYAGGTVGYIASSGITITGGLEEMDFTGVTRISAGGFGTGNAGGVADGGTTTVTLQNITAEDGIADYEGEISGGRKPDEFEVRRKLVLKNVTALKATLADFDEVQVEGGSIVQFKGLGGAAALSLGGESEMDLTNPEELEESTVKEVTVGSGSKLTLRGGKYTGMVTTNGGEIVLEDKVSYKTEMGRIDDDQVAMSTKGRYSIGAGSSLELWAADDGRVRGTTEVDLFTGGTYRTALTGEEDGGGSVLLHLQGEDGSGKGGTNTLTVNLVGDGTECTGVIRARLENFAAATRVKGWDERRDYTLQLVGDNRIELGKGVLSDRQGGGGESIFDMTEERIAFEKGATMTVWVDLANLDDVIYSDENSAGVRDLDFAVFAGSVDLNSWNGNERILVQQGLEREGWIGRWTKEGTLSLHYPSSDWGVRTYTSSKNNAGSSWKVGPGENIYEAVGQYKNVVVDSVTEIDFSSVEEVPRDYWTDGLEIHNLSGGQGGRLTITGNGEMLENGEVTLKNKYKTVLGEGGALTDGMLRYAGDLTVRRARLSVFHTDTTGEKEGNSVNLVTEVGGKLDLSEGMGLALKRGVLRLTGAGSDLGNGGGNAAVEFTNGTYGQLVLKGGSAAVRGRISISLPEDPDAPPQIDREHILLEEDGVLELADGAVVGGGVEIGNRTPLEEESGNTVLVSGSDVAMENGTKLIGVHLALRDGAAVQLGSGDTLSLFGLESGTKARISGTRDMEIRLSEGDHVSSADLSEYAGTMTFGGSSWTQYFTTETGKAQNWNVTLQEGAKVHLNAINSLTRTNDGMNMGRVHVASGGELTLGFTFEGGVAGHSAPGAGFLFGDFILEQGATLTLYAEGGNPTDQSFVLGEVREGGEIDLEKKMDSEVRVAAAAEDIDGIQFTPEEDKEIRVEVAGSGLLHVEGAVVKKEGNRIIAEFKTAEINKLAEAVAGEHQNAQQGAQAVWEATKQAYEPGSDMDKLAVGASGMLVEKEVSGESRALANTMAASVGTGLTGLSPAFSQDVHGRITALRNRTNGASWSEAADDMVEDYPYYHVWVNGEANYHELDDDGLAPGYRLNSWGGSLGVTAEVSDRTRVGLALTAMTGDYKCSALDTVDGDLVTTWLGLFLSTTSGSWQHTLVLTGGIADVSINRTVPCGGDSYRTKGDTDGLAAGLLYELGYTAYVNAEGTNALQAIFNAEWRYASIKGYTETGSNAALQVEEMEQSVATFGAGIRWQRLMSAAIANRNPLLELRALAKVDVGDDHGEAKTRFVGQQYETSLRGAEIGAFGVEIGGEISIPVGGRTTRVFIDAGAELRSGYTSAEASIGLKTMF